MKVIHIIGLSALCFLSTGKAFADFPLPNKTVPFTEGGWTYVYEFEYQSHTGTYYVTYCPAYPVMTFDTQSYDGWWKLMPHYSSWTNCQQFKFVGSTWVSSSDGYWYMYLSQYQCLGNVIRTNSDMYYASGMPTINFSWQYCNLGVATSGRLLLSRNWDFTWNEPYVPTHLTFPVAGYTAYSVPISSVMDHEMPQPYQNIDGVVVSFEGEVGDLDPVLDCYAQEGDLDFGLNINYVGTTGTGGSQRLCYNDHPGYDFPFVQGTDVRAPESGTLCVSLAENQIVDDLWRDTEHCPYFEEIDFSDSWSSYHTFYILHKGKWINGERANYITKFLHSVSLEATVQSQVIANGYVAVNVGQHVAESGSFGAGNANHIHMETWKQNGTTWTLVDPYGDGTNGILWQH